MEEGLASESKLGHGVLIDEAFGRRKIGPHDLNSGIH